MHNSHFFLQKCNNQIVKNTSHNAGNGGISESLIFRRRHSPAPLETPPPPSPSGGTWTEKGIDNGRMVKIIIIIKTF